MHPILSDVRRLFWTMVLWLLAGIFIAKILVAAKLAAWGNALFFSIPVLLIYGFITFSAYYICRSLPLVKRSFTRVTTVFFASSLISGFTWLGICLLWNKLGESLGEPWAGIEISSHLSLLLLINGSIFYLLSILAHDVLIAFENVHSAERNAAESRVLARDAELQVLRTQISPHFLFNSLNSISALTTIDAAGARSMTIELANFFRQTLTLAEKEKIALSEEIALCSHYLAIEKIRFGTKLQVEFDIDSSSLTSLIPPMSLQGLVENAIKHGIRDLVGGGTIIIRSIVRDHWLHISIENPVDVHPSSIAGNGSGLNNLRARLSSLYGDKAKIVWRKAPTFFIVEITLPLEYPG
jgi:two-component system sensor histidine kinase AlgZ